MTPSVVSEECIIAPTDPIKPRVAVINSVCVERDAISESVRGTVEALSEVADVRLFTYRCDFSEIDATIVESTRDILLDSYFNTADVLFYHYGIYYDFFDTLLIGNGRAKRVVYFHNVTPKQVLPPSAHFLAEKSLRQRANLLAAERVLTNSEFTRNDLVELGIDSSRVEVCPLYTKFSGPPKRRRAGGLKKSVELLYVGRFVASKGVTDLLTAMRNLRQAGLTCNLTLVGNLAFSDPEYVARMQKQISELALQNCISFQGTVSDTELRSLYERSDIFVMPSYHEGFCVPILEAYHAGCVPVTYDSGNLAAVVGECGVVVPTGDSDALTRALALLVPQLNAGFPTLLDLGRSQPVPRSAYQKLVSQHLSKHTFGRFAAHIRAVCGYHGGGVPEHAISSASAG